MGEEPGDVCRYLGKGDCINHVHFRNVVVRKPYVDYTEVFLDEGEVDMFGVMRELVRQRYPRGLYPQPVSRRRGLRRRDLQRRLRPRDAAGGADALNNGTLEPVPSLTDTHIPA